jgi:hypothetical protein
MSSSALLESSSSHGDRQDSDDWWLNHRIILLWYEWPTCKCGRVATVDVWEHDGTDRVGRQFFKYPDLDSDFVVQYFSFSIPILIILSY